MHDSGSGETTRYYYDAQGRLVNRSMSVGNSHEVVEYQYDRYGRLMTTQVSDSWDMSAAYYTDYSYDEESRVKSVVSGRENQTAAVQSFCTYDDLDRVSKRYTKQMTGSTGVTKLTTTISRKSGSDQVTKLEQDSAGYDVTYSYTYNDDGYIAEVSHGTNPTRYTYDGAGQLIREDNKVAGKTWTWSYDAAGNILSKSTYAYTTGTLGTATATVSYGYGNTNWGDLLTSYNGTAISYDNAGNPTSYRGNACTWNNGRQLAGFGAWNFTYDADGLRTRRAMGTATVYEYTYVDGVLTKMTVGSNTLRFAYSVDGTPCSVNYNGTEYYYVTNLQGDVTAILDGSGNAVAQYTYDAWGKVLTATVTQGRAVGQYNPLRYRGYVYDTETGLYYLQSRYYDPEVGRFINADVFVSTGQGFGGNNMFAYCCNSPMAFSDDCGHSIRPSIKIINDGANGDAITEGLGIAHALGYFSDVSSSKISVDLEKCMKSIDYLHTVVGLSMNIIFSEIAERACDKYKDLYGEPFLLSDSWAGYRWWGCKDRMKAVKILFYVSCFFAAVGAYAEALWTYFPVQRPFFYIGQWFLIPAVLLLIICIGRKVKAWDWGLLALTALLLIGGWTCNCLRYSGLEVSYYYKDTEFNSMARKFLPELSSFDDAQSVTHYHGIHGSIYEDEWIAVKVSYDERDYLEKLKQVIEKYSFYEGEWIDTGSYSIQESEFSIDDYTVRIVVPNAATGELCGQVIAYSNQDYSIIYLFLESDSLEFTELDGIVRIIWPELLG